MLAGGILCKNLIGQIRKLTIPKRIKAIHIYLNEYKARLLGATVGFSGVPYLSEA